jgi:hypothetical protein
MEWETMTPNDNSARFGRIVAEKGSNYRDEDSKTGRPTPPR